MLSELRGKKQAANSACVLLVASIPKMETEHSSKMAVNFFPIPHYHISEYTKLKKCSHFHL
jgi:predicted house-cleaning NTP pyrophosphatase (Maf/HAM1 superfamily)